jgi:hypothetical protein
VEIFAEVAVHHVREEMNQSQEQRDPEDGKNEEVKRWIEASVIGKGLGLFFGHEGGSLKETCQV